MWISLEEEEPADVMLMAGGGGMDGCGEGVMIF